MHLSQHLTRLYMSPPLLVVLQDGVPRAFPVVRGNWPCAVELDLQLDNDFADVVEVGASRGCPHTSRQRHECARVNCHLHLPCASPAVTAPPRVDHTRAPSSSRARPWRAHAFSYRARLCATQQRNLHQWARLLQLFRLHGCTSLCRGPSRFGSPCSMPWHPRCAHT